jgi:hypothetical protein
MYSFMQRASINLIHVYIIINKICDNYRHDLDGSSVKKQDKFMSPFRVIMEVDWNPSSEDQAVYNAASWQNLPYPKANPSTCFSSRVEEEETAKMLCT